jgi:prepilin-type N-terminal cleavage/methylation domain-containing protein
MLINDQKPREQIDGFTLVEIIAVLAIIAILASLSLPKFINLEGNAKQKILYSALSELNTREKLLWSKLKLSDEGWVDDAALFSQLDTDFGLKYKWAPKASTTGGHLHYEEEKIKLNRSPSTSISPGKWSIK